MDSSLDALVHRAPRHWTVQFRQRASFGTALAAGGDVNGDGFPDLLVGASRASSSAGTYAGAAFLFRGGANGFENGPWWTRVGDRKLGTYGNAVALVDINKDKLVEVFVAGPRIINSSGREGRLECYYGRTNQLSAKPEDFVPHGNELAYSPSGVTSAGDVNGDGYQDLLAAARNYSGTLAGQGATFLYLGSKTGMVTRSAWQAFGSQTNESFGAALAGIGDVNGDGYDDVAIGAPGFVTNGQPCGRVCIYLGSANGLEQSPEWIIPSTAPGSDFGRIVKPAGDVNRDGLADFVVSAPGTSAITNLAGTVYLFYGSKGKALLEPAWQMTGEGREGLFGAALSTGGDVDGDGFSDLLASAAFLPASQGKRVGRVYLFRGNGVSFASRPEWILHGGNKEASVGQTLCQMTDLNLDGFADLIIGSPHFVFLSTQTGNAVRAAGRVDVFYGGTNGFRTGQVFPTDGVNSRMYSTPSRVEPAPVFAEVNVPRVPGKHFMFIVPVLVALTLGGGAFWLRQSHRSGARAERTRIARDLHDDLGAQLSILQREAAGLHPAATREAMLALDRAVWAANPENDTLENLVTFVSQYAAEFFTDSGIRLRFDAPMEVPDMQLSPDWRKNVFLAVKEALNNVLKHSAASEVCVAIRLDQRELEITIDDNGKGLLPATDFGPGNGLKNMADRMKTVHGQFEIRPREQGGTQVKFTVGI